jgi:hypothetical protein
VGQSGASLPFHVTSPEAKPLAPTAESKPTTVPTQLTGSVFMLPTSEELDQRALMAYTRFLNAEEYIQFVNNPKFMEAKTIRAAIIFCGYNIAEEKPGWNWVQERDDLTRLEKFVNRLNELSTPANSEPVPAPSSVQVRMTKPVLIPVAPGDQPPVNPILYPARPLSEVLEQLRDAFRKKVDTANSEILRAEAAQKSFINQFQTIYKLGYASIVRKSNRVSWNNLSWTNHAPDFRSNAFIRRLELELEIDSLKLPSAAEAAADEMEFVNLERPPTLKPPALPTTSTSSPSAAVSSEPASTSAAQPAVHTSSLSLTASLPSPAPSVGPDSATLSSSSWLPRSLPVALPSLTGSLPSWPSVSFSGWLSRPQSSSSLNSQPSSVSSPQPIISPVSSPVTTTSVLPVTAVGTVPEPSPALSPSGSERGSG